MFGGVLMNIELRLSKLARDRGLAGPIAAAAGAYFCKRPPRQMNDDAAHAALERFVADGPMNRPLA